VSGYEGGVGGGMCVVGNLCVGGFRGKVGEGNAKPLM